MNILIIQERIPAFREFRECFALKSSFERKGHSISLWGDGHDNFGEESLNILSEWCDVVFIIEQYQLNWIPNSKYHNKPIFYWSIDTHTNFDRHLNFCKFLNIKNIITSVYGCDERFKQNGMNSIWIPNSYPKDLIDDLKLERPFDLGYCGSHYPDRWQDFNRMINTIHIRFDVMVRNTDMVNALNSYKIAWNKNYSTDINYRTFEATGAGCLLMTNKTPGLELLFDIGKHIVVYSDVNDCISKVKYYLKNQEEMKEIALAGYKHVRDNHSYDNRVDDYLNFFNSVYT